MTQSQKTDRDLCKAILAVKGIAYDDWLADIHRQYVNDNYQALCELASDQMVSGTLKYTKKGMKENGLD